MLCHGNPNVRLRQLVYLDTVNLIFASALEMRYVKISSRSVKLIGHQRVMAVAEMG